MKLHKNAYSTVDNLATMLQLLKSSNDINSASILAALRNDLDVKAEYLELDYTELVNAFTQLIVEIRKINKELNVEIK